MMEIFPFMIPVWKFEVLEKFGKDAQIALFLEDRDWFMASNWIAGCIIGEGVQRAKFLYTMSGSFNESREGGRGL